MNTQGQFDAFNYFYKAAVPLGDIGNKQDVLMRR